MSQLPRLFLALAVCGAVIIGAVVFLGGEAPKRSAGALALGSAPLAPGRPSEAPAELEQVEGALGGGAARTAAVNEASSAAPRRAPKEAADVAAPRLAVGPFTGRLLDPAGGPIANAKLELRSWSERDAIQFGGALFGQKPWPAGTSGKDGRFSIPDDDRIGKSIAVIVKARGFLDTPFQSVREDAASAALGDLFLEPAVIVQGWVHDERGAPIQGARLRLGKRDEDPGARMMAAFGMGGMLSLGETDADGRFELGHVKEGELTLIAEHPAHHPARWTGVTPRVGSVLPDVEFELQRAGSIQGVVRDFPAGRRGVQVAARKLPDQEGAARDLAAEGDDLDGADALFDAAFSPAGRETAEIGEGGVFELQGLARVGRYELTIVERQDFVRSVALSRPVTVSSGATGVVMDYDAGATVRMRLLDRETQRPIEAAEVTGNWGEARARVFFSPDAITRPKSFPGGELHLYELRPPSDPSKLNLTIIAPGYVELQPDPIDVGARDFVDVGDIQLEPAKKLRFLVVDATTGKPISRAQVSVREPNEVDDMAALMQRGMDAAGRTIKDRTGKDGRVALDSLSVKTAALTIRANDYPTYKDPDFPAQDTSKEHRIPLVKGGDLEVYVVDPSGQPVERARVLLRLAGTEGDGKGDDTNGDGLVRWRAIEPARYEVRAYRRGANPADIAGAEVKWETADVFSGRPTEVVLAVSGAATIVGTVRLAGEPLAGAQLSLAARESDPAARDAARMQRRFGGRRGGGGRASDSTDSAGRFTLVDVVPGEYDLVIGHSSLTTDTIEPIDVELGENRIDVTVVVAAIEGRVVDDDRKPISGARVSVAPAQTGASASNADGRRAFRSLMRDTSRDAVTDADGRFRLQGLSTAESLELTARASGHVAATSPAMLLGASETRTDVELRLTRAGSVEVVIVSDAPNAAGGFISARYKGEGKFEDIIEVSRGSNAVVDGLAPGPWELTLTNFGGPGGRGTTVDTPKTVEVSAGERARVEFRR